MGAELTIYRSTDRDGATYALGPRSLARLREAFGSAVHTRPRVFVAHESADDREHVDGAVAPAVIQLLTGLHEERLSSLGPVVFRDAVTDHELPRRNHKRKD